MICKSSIAPKTQITDDMLEELKMALDSLTLQLRGTEQDNTLAFSI